MRKGQHAGTHRSSISVVVSRRLVQGRVLPPLAGILRAPAGQPDMLVEGALDLLAALLRPSRPEARARPRQHPSISPCTFSPCTL